MCIERLAPQPFGHMAWFQNTASSLDAVASHIARQSQDEKNQDAASDNENIGVAESAPPTGITIAPGIRFSERLWARLGAQGRDKEKQIRREKLTDATAFPEIPSNRRADPLSASQAKTGAIVGLLEGEAQVYVASGPGPAPKTQTEVAAARRVSAGKKR